MNINKGLITGIYQTGQIIAVAESKEVAEEYVRQDREKYPGPRNDTGYMRLAAILHLTEDAPEAKEEGEKVADYPTASENEGRRGAIQALLQHAAIASHDLAKIPAQAARLRAMYALNMLGVSDEEINIVLRNLYVTEDQS